MEKEFNEQAIRWWVEELESGEYTQTTGYLHRTAKSEGGIYSVPAGFCCLGVACETAIKHGVALQIRENNSVVSYDGEETVFPAAVLAFLGLKDPDPEIGDSAATTLNDEQGFTLTEIAREIRRHWLGEDV